MAQTPAGKSALALSRDLGLSYKSAFVLLHKLREAMAEEMKDRVVSGDGKVTEVDGGYFGGYVALRRGKSADFTGYWQRHVTYPTQERPQSTGV
jgi:hypothetical protein